MRILQQYVTLRDQADVDSSGFIGIALPSNLFSTR